MENIQPIRTYYNNIIMFNPYSGYYIARTNVGYLRADTLKGIKYLIKKTRKDLN